MFRQLKDVYPELPPPHVSLLSPTAYYDRGWHERDSAYIHTIEDDRMSALTTIPGVYHIGTHNLESKFSYTTMESAVTNAIEWFNGYEGGRRVVHNPVAAIRILWVIRFVVILYLIRMVLRKRYEKTSFA
jgi:hypothetical protein